MPKTPELLHVGYSNYVMLDKLLGIHIVNSVPVKRMISEAERNLKVMDSTTGKKTRSVLFMTGGLLVLSAIDSETLANRIKTLKGV